MAGTCGWAQTMLQQVLNAIPTTTRSQSGSSSRRSRNTKLFCRRPMCLMMTEAKAADLLSFSRASTSEVCGSGKVPMILPLGLLPWGTQVTGPWSVSARRTSTPLGLEPGSQNGRSSSVPSIRSRWD
eukprot:scaffold5108_cov29-Prasinocladus_malaysianus.AAC.1